jgi:hypothetical protein
MKIYAQRRGKSGEAAAANKNEEVKRKRKRYGHRSE